jgi:LysM domain
VPDAERLADWVNDPLAGDRSLKALAILLWLVWAVFVTVLAMETYAALSGARLPRIRLATPLHGVAAGMVGATATALSGPAAHAAPPPQPVDAVATITDPAAAIDTPARAMAAPAVAAPTYIVVAGDRLSAIADRFLGDPAAYPRIAHLNPQYQARDARFPDHIEPGWRLTLPPEAHDRGPRPHARGPAHLPTAPATSMPSQPVPGTAGPGRPPRPAEPTPPPPAATPDSPAGGGDADGSEPDGQVRGSHGTLAGAGLVTTLLVRAVTAARRRAQPYYQPGVAQPTPRGGRTERRLLAAQRPTDVDRLDHALRDLAAILTDRTLYPDVFGVRVNAGDVHLLLTDPAPPVPAPWLDEGAQWVLPALHELTTTEPVSVPPLPALATVGSRSGRHLMLDLERLGTLSIGGNPERAHELLTYIACELALSVWSQHVRVELAGYGDDADLIAELNPDRVTIRRNPADAIAELRTLLAVDTATSPEPLDTFGVRLRGEPADPRVLLIARPDEHARTELAALDRDLAAAGRRCGIAAVATLRTPPVGRAAVILTDDGAVQVDLPWLRLSTDAAALPAAELEPLAEIMRFARITTPPAPRAHWSSVVDPVTAVPRLFDPTFTPEPELEPAPPRPADDFAALSTSDDATVEVDPRDPDLDSDMAAWRDPASHRPKVAILGRVHVDSPLDRHGEATDVFRHRRHRRLADELAVFLLSRPDASARREQIEDALWSGEPVNPTTSRGVVTGLRARLGTAPDGAPWLSDTAGRPGTPYQLHAGVLFDWQLFTRLRDRAARRGGAGAAADLHAALRLVRGVPFDDAKDSTGHRQTYTWLPESPIGTGRIVPAITDVAHRLAQHHLAHGDTAAVRWAVNQAWLADPYRGTDELWLDLMRAEKADQHGAVLHNLLDELLKARDVDVPEELPHPTYQALRELLPDRA